MSKTSRLCWGFLERRERLGLTWRGRLFALLACFAFAVLFVTQVHPFLAVTQPLRCRVLVVEGWVSDHALEQTVREFGVHSYEKLFVTGGPIDPGGWLAEYKTYAQLGAATLTQMRFDTNKLQAVPAPYVSQDRTYTSAVALREWLRSHGGIPNEIHVISMDCHSRRTRLLYQKAFGDGVNVGITAVLTPGYQSGRWWKSSAGVRTVVDELVAYTYARLFFWPPKP